MVVIILLSIDYFGRYKSFCGAMSPVYVPFLSMTIPIYSVLRSKTEYKKKNRPMASREGSPASVIGSSWYDSSSSKSFIEFLVASRFAEQLNEYCCPSVRPKPDVMSVGVSVRQP